LIADIGVAVRIRVGPSYLSVCGFWGHRNGSSLFRFLFVDSFPVHFA